MPQDAVGRWFYEIERRHSGFWLMSMRDKSKKFCFRDRGAVMLFWKSTGMKGLTSQMRSFPLKMHQFHFRPCLMQNPLGRSRHPVAHVLSDLENRFFWNSYATDRKGPTRTNDRRMPQDAVGRWFYEKKYGHRHSWKFFQSIMGLNSTRFARTGSEVTTDTTDTTDRNDVPVVRSVVSEFFTE